LIAAKRGNPQIFEALLTYIDNVNVKDMLDRDALELIEKFIEKGDKKNKMRLLWKKKKEGELDKDEYKYRTSVFLDSLKKPNLKEKYDKILSKAATKR